MAKARTGTAKTLVKGTVPEMEGRKAPSFELPDGGGKTVSLKELLAGGNLVLYFYPKDMTPGCTTEACDFRDTTARLKALGAQVVGVSADSPESHRKFIDKHALELSAAERRRQPRHAALRSLQEEVALRTRVHGNRAHHLPHRSRRRDSQGLPQGQGRGPRRRRGRGGQGATLRHALRAAARAPMENGRPRRLGRIRTAHACAARRRSGSRAGIA